MTDKNVIKYCNACLTVIPEGSEHRHVVRNIDMVQEFIDLSTHTEAVKLLEEVSCIIKDTAKELGSIYNPNLSAGQWLTAYQEFRNGEGRSEKS